MELVEFLGMNDFTDLQNVVLGSLALKRLIQCFQSPYKYVLVVNTLISGKYRNFLSSFDQSVRLICKPV